MKKLLSLAFALLVTTGAMAQFAPGTFSLQPKVGMNVANITDASDGDARVDFAGGIEGEYQISDIFSLSGALMYSRQGNKLDGHAWSPSYLNIPIMANVYVVKGLAVKLGVQPGFNVDDDDQPLEMNTFDFSIPVGLSYQFSGVPIVIDARYNWGLTNIFKNNDFTDFKNKNSVFQFTVGYKFAL